MCDIFTACSLLSATWEAVSHFAFLMQSLALKISQPSIQATLLRLVSLVVTDLFPGKTFYHSNSFLGAGARALQTARQGFVLCCHHTTLPLQLLMARNHPCPSCIQLGQHIFLGSRTRTSLVHKETEAGTLTSSCPLHKKHSPSLLPTPGRQAGSSSPYEQARERGNKNEAVVKGIGEEKQMTARGVWG